MSKVYVYKITNKAVTALHVCDNYKHFGIDWNAKI